MADGNYTLVVKVDDSSIKKLEERLNGIMGGKSGGGKSGGVLNTLMGGGKNDILGNLAKLGGIALGVGLLVEAVSKIADAVVGASPYLQAMMKLMDASISLILRPIGDFFGAFLRPILLFFLTRVALPFYKLIDPLMMWLGGQLGTEVAASADKIMNGAAGLVTDPIGTLQEIGSNVQNDLIGYGTQLGDGIKKFIDWLTTPPENDVIGGIVEWFKKISEFDLLGAVQTAFDTIFTSIINWDGWAWIQSVFAGLYTQLTSWDGFQWITTLFAGLFSIITSWDGFKWIETIFTDVYNKIISFDFVKWVTDSVNSIMDAIKSIDIVKMIQDFIDRIFGINQDKGNPRDHEPPVPIEIQIQSNIASIQGELDRAIRPIMEGLLGELRGK